jgi:lipoprotein-anchoring transpeptidase ErfK/SrfK
MKFWITAVLWGALLVGCGHKPPSESSAPPPAVPAPASPPLAASAAGSPVTDAALKNVRELRAEGKLAEARGILQPLVSDTISAKPDAAADLLGEIDIQIVMTPTPAPEKADYTIAAGDALGKIAKKFGTTVELIKKSNNLSSDTIRVGDRLRVYQGHFAVTVSKTANTLQVTDGGKFFKRYRVGTGQYSKTPVGEFKITSRVSEPPWWRSDGKTIPFGDPENILGTHWLGLDVPGYGIHGTWETNSIGKQATAGCIRLLNDDVAELYTILPVGTPVAIHD